MEIHRDNVGRIAERIAMNELEAHGFHIIDLAYMSKTFANVDFIASKGGRAFNVQVKGASNNVSSRRAIHYGFCDDDIVAGTTKMFNGKADAPLKADVVVFMALRSPSDYWALVMPVDRAEAAAQINLDRYYRQPKANGEARKPHKVWVDLERSKKARKQADESTGRERALLLAHLNAWDLLAPPLLDQP